MNLPTKDAPLGWKVSRKGESTTVERVSGPGITNDHVIGAAVAGLCPICFTIAVQWFSTKEPVIEILARWETLRLLFFLPLLLAVVLWVKRLFDSTYVYGLTAGELRFRRNEGGTQKTDNIPRERVTGLTRYVFNKGDDEDGTSLGLNWRKPGGESEELYLGFFAEDEEAEWFTKLFEAWSGQRARLGELEHDDEDEDEIAEVVEDESRAT